MQYNPTFSPEVSSSLSELVTLYRSLHQNPELSFAEYSTQKLILDRLAEWGIPAVKMGGTGVVAEILGNKSGPTILLRADMDGLPIQEANEVDWVSLNEGCMHACGHDAHTAMLLVASRIIAEKGVERGRVRLMFQPAEEIGQGAQLMVEEGVLNDTVPGLGESGDAPESALALHVWSGLPTGVVSAASGPVMADDTELTMRVIGVGTHAAMPSKGSDPVVVTAQVISCAQALIPRRVSASEEAVISFCSIHGGKAHNIIPEEVVVRGTMRTFDPNIKSMLKSSLEKMANGIADAAGCTVEFEWKELPVTRNDPKLSLVAREVAGEVVGAGAVTDNERSMGAEDWCRVADKVPAVFVFVGCGVHDDASEDEFATISAPHHNPRFLVEENALRIGVEIMLRFVERLTKGL